MPATTRLRSKIGSHLSYPCTLREIERALSPASERNDIDVSFWAYKPPRPNQVLERHPLVEARYSKRFSGEYAGEWHYEIVVHPVPRGSRAQIRTILFGSVTDRMRDWLLAERSPIWYTSSHRFSVEVDASHQPLFCERPKV